MSDAAVIVTILLVALFTFSSAIKLLGLRQSVEIRDRLGILPNQWRLIGFLELAGVVGVLVGRAWAPAGVAAAIGLALLSAGAVATHVRAHDGLTQTVPAVLGIALAVTTAALQAT